MIGPVAGAWLFCCAWFCNPCWLLCNGGLGELVSSPPPKLVFSVSDSNAPRSLDCAPSPIPLPPGAASPKNPLTPCDAPGPKTETRSSAVSLGTAPLPRKPADPPPWPTTVASAHSGWSLPPPWLPTVPPTPTAPDGFGAGGPPAVHSLDAEVLAAPLAPSTVNSYMASPGRTDTSGTASLSRPLGGCGSSPFMAA